jgi:hypothetical protein
MNSRNSEVPTARHLIPWLAGLTLSLVAAVGASDSCGTPPTGPLRYEPAPLEPGRRILRVGPGHKFTSPKDAVRAAKDGDAILIDPGEYPEERAVWTQHRLLLRGVDGRPHLIAGKTLAQGKAIWVINGDDVVIENVEFSGAQIPIHNGAGIRMQGDRLTVRASYFHDSDMGILTDNDPAQELLIEFSEFARNGHASGQAHNLYVGAIGRFELRYSSSYGAHIGHLLKSRAKRNMIVYNRLADEPAGPSSYELDFPRSTDTTVIGNLIVQSATSPNGAILSYGAEDKGRPPVGRLRVAWNTFYSSRSQPVFIFNRSAQPALIVGNLFSGAAGQDIRGPAEARGNRTVPARVFADPRGLDFRLRRGEIEPDDQHRHLDAPDDLRPAFEYVHPDTVRHRAPDSLAYPGAYGACNE